MSTAIETKASSSRASTQPPAALLVELEGVAFPVRAVLFEAARSHLAGRGAKLDVAQFLRCAGPVVTLAAQLTELLSLDGGSEELSAAMNRALHEHFSKNTQLGAGLEKVIKAAAQRGIPTAVLTGLPEEIAQTIFAAAGLEGREIQLFVFSDEEKSFPRADAWLKAVKNLGKTPRFCIAFGSSHAACKSALSVGMRAVAVPDAYTGHHDFSGADRVLDGWDDVNAVELLNDLIPPLR